jgi:hypothetical protein
MAMFGYQVDRILPTCVPKGTKIKSRASNYLQFQKWLGLCIYNQLEIKLAANKNS